MLETKNDLRIDDVVLALEQDKVKSAAVLLRQLLMQPGPSGNSSRVALLADKVAAACLQHDEYQDAAAIYRLLLCEDCGLYALPSDEAVVTRTKLLHVLARLGQVTPFSVKTN